MYSGGSGLSIDTHFVDIELSYDVLSPLPTLLSKHFNHPHPYIEIATAISDIMGSHNMKGATMVSASRIPYFQIVTMKTRCWLQSSIVAFSGYEKVSCVPSNREVFKPCLANCILVAMLAYNSCLTDPCKCISRIAKS